MWKSYRNIIQNYPRVPLSEERRLISKAQKGSKKSKNEIVLRHIGFLIFRIHRRVLPYLIQRFGEDLLEEAIVVIYKKIESYNLYHRDKQENTHPVKFVSSIFSPFGQVTIITCPIHPDQHQKLQTKKSPHLSNGR